MKFSTKELYGLRAMAELARSFGQGPVSLAEVSRVEGLSLSYMEQVIPPLRKAGLVESRRGAYGGYALARQPAQITVGDVIRALEGSIVQIPCQSEHAGGPCVREGICSTSNVWKEVRNSLIETLDSITLADLLERTTSAGHCSLLTEGIWAS
jgi:Rrf2 family protein